MGKREKIDVVSGYKTDVAKKMAKSITGKELYPLRINATTVIYTKKSNLTEEYAEEYRKRTGLKP